MFSRPTLLRRLLPPALYLLAALASAPPARAEIEFTGVLTAGAKSTFALVETTTKETRWLGVGDSFAGWKIASYDAAKDTLTLTKDKATKTVALNQAAVGVAKPAAPATVSGDLNIKVGSATMAGTINLVDGVPYDVDLPNGVNVQVTSKVQPDGNVLYKSVFRHGQGAAAEILSAPSVSSRPGQGFSIQVGDISFGFDPKATKQASP